MSSALVNEYKKSPDKFIDKYRVFVGAQLSKSNTKYVPAVPGIFRDKTGKVVNQSAIETHKDADKLLDNKCLKLLGYGLGTQKKVSCDFLDMGENQGLSANFFLASGLTYLPTYFLPWHHDRIMYFKLASGMGMPDYFFTSSLSGCSIYITGSSNEPTVYHANAQNIAEDPPKEKGPKEVYMDSLFKLANSEKESLLHKLTWFDYSKTYENLVSRKEEQGRKYVEDEFGKQVAYKEVTVIGYKKKGEWKFYYQVNINMAYHRPKKALFARMKHGNIYDGIKSYCEPIP